MIKPNIRWEELDRECWDVVVIGAGPAGALAAQQMAIRGGRVLLVERKACPRRKVCGACLSRRAVEILAAVGLSDIVQRLKGKKLREFRLSAAGGCMKLQLPTGVAVSRASLDAELVQAAIDAGAVFLPETSALVAACAADARSVVLQPNAASGKAAIHVTARVVVAADGLGHPCLSPLHEFAHLPVTASRIGAGCEVPGCDADFPEGTIQMGIGRHGYVGLVVVETGTLNVAAAIDPHFVRDCGGLGDAAAKILREANLPQLPSLSGATWQGTLPLTRPPSKLAAERIFLIGDAAGYIEPFTGEGIAWALTTAVQVAPLAQAAWTSWESSLETAWGKRYACSVGRQQWLCRLLARGLRSPWCVACVMAGLERMPWLAPKLIQWIHAPIPLNVANMPMASTLEAVRTVPLSESFVPEEDRSAMVQRRCEVPSVG